MYLVGTADFCRVFSVTKRTVYNWEIAGKIKAHIVPNRIRNRYMWDIHQYCLDNGIPWKKVKDIIEGRTLPESLEG